MSVLFIRRVGSYNESPAKAWEALLKYIDVHDIKKNELRYLGVAHDDPNITEKNMLRYDACIHSGKEIIKEGETGVQTIPGGTYAIFIHRGSYHKLEETFDYAFGQWLPKSGFKIGDQLCFTEYLNPELRDSHPELLLTKVYIPVHK